MKDVEGDQVGGVVLCGLHCAAAPAACTALQLAEVEAAFQGHDEFAVQDQVLVTQGGRRGGEVGEGGGQVRPLAGLHHDVTAAGEDDRAEAVRFLLEDQPAR